MTNFARALCAAAGLGVIVVLGYDAAYNRITGALEARRDRRRHLSDQDPKLANASAQAARGSWGG